MAQPYTTAGDELKFVTGVVGERFLSAPLRDAMFDLGSRVGYGWFKSNSSRFGETVYSHERPRPRAFLPLSPISRNTGC